MSRDHAVEKKPARDRILELMSDLAWHGRKELERVGGNRYSARILELKRQGYKIDSQELPDGDGKRYALMSLVRGAPQEKQVKVFISEYDAEKLLVGVLTGTAEAAIQDALGSFQHNRYKL